MAEAGLAPRRQMSIRFDQLKRTPALNIVGLPELIGLAGAALLAILTIFAYFYFYVPAGFKLKSVELERQRLLGIRQASGVALEQGITTKDSVDRINSSLTDFESHWLTGEASGRMSLYTVLNTLIKSNGLRNTAGPIYSSLDPIGTKTEVQPTVSAEKQSNAKWQSIYPGIAVSVTVEGPYQNVRHFVRDIEMNRQFLIINAVELERVTQSGVTLDQPLTSPAAPTTPRSSAGTQPAAGGSGTLVSLRVDLATYFQRAETKTTTP
ncbi:MAG TPA: GspMb/PilO family protein [Pyrinomonadaceae bacterium]|nr:GspMb/PilO family protein [Pyrinomonadaceae bacterium]